MNRGGWWLLTGLILLALSGCSFSKGRLVDADQPGGEVEMELKPGQPVGQTFVARHGGLAGVEFFLRPATDIPVTVTLHLLPNPGATEEIATASLRLPAGGVSRFYRFTIPYRQDSHGRYYYAFLEAAQPGVTIASAGGDTYPDGAAYRSHRPLDVQSRFRLVYVPKAIVLDLARMMLNGIGLLTVAGLLFIVPGWLLLAWLLPVHYGRTAGLGRAEKLALACGVSLALYPLLFLWTDLVDLHLGPLYAWGPVVLGLAALAWRYRRWRPRQGWAALQAWARSDALWPDLVLLFILALVFGVRLLVVRTLDAPMWGDSYQHAVIAQLLVDNGGLFDSWEPYAELQTFTYHFGFHSAVAVFHWLTGVPVYRATLWVGQILNGLAVLALYPLSMKVSGNRWAGSASVLIAGLLLPMPMFYVNWGRYTQLAGQVILPTAVFFTWEFLEDSKKSWTLAGLGWLAIGGLALTHYRVLIFYVIFVAGWLVLNLRKGTGMRALSGVSTLAIGAGLLFLPWFLQTFAGSITWNFGKQLTTLPTHLSDFTRQYNAIGDITRFMAPWGWLLLVIAVGFGLWQRRREFLVISLWWFLLLIATNPHWLNLPGSGSISNFALFIAVYIPAGLLIGDLVGWWAKRRDNRFWKTLLTILTVGLALFGAKDRLGDLNVVAHALITRPDLRAMTWIRENTPESAKFLVNSFFAYGGSVVVGSDGGWWLPLLAGRANTVPPLNYGTERGPRPDYRIWVNELTARVQQSEMESAEVLAALMDRGVTHVYIGQQGGKVNYEGPGPLNPDVLLKSKHYRLVYHQDRVWIFEIVR